MTTSAHGRLLDVTDAPASGERFVTVAATGSTTVEQILSSDTPDPKVYDQDHDEWVVVLAGSAVLEIDGRQLELAARDWVLLPAGIPHRVVATAAGTSWLAVHVAA
jgi:cupin 2 domain-containing protein